MSITLTIKARSQKTFAISKFLEDYFDALEHNFIEQELENGFAYRASQGVVGLVFEDSLLKEIDDENFMVKKITLGERELKIVKIAHQNSHKSRLAVIKRIKDLGNLESPFILLEHTSLKTKLNDRPPWITEQGNIYTTVGSIDAYFEKEGWPKRYKTDKRGLEYTKSLPQNQRENTRNFYFSEFIDNDNISDLRNTEKTGLKHFTNILHEDKGELYLTSIQNDSKINAARYFTFPDIVICSNDTILRHYRALNYANDPESIISKRLKRMSYTIPPKV